MGAPATRLGCWVVIAVLLAPAVVLSQDTEADSGWLPARIDSVYVHFRPAHSPPDSLLAGSVIHFRNGEKRNADLMNLKYIGMLRAANKAPFLIFSGRGCDLCDAGTSIYIHSPSDGDWGDEATEPRWPYPGSLRDFFTKELVQRSRAFYGECLPQGRPGAVWSLEFNTDSAGWTKSMYMVEVRNDSLHERQGPDSASVLSSIQEAVRKRRCAEIPGRDQETEP